MNAFIEQIYLEISKRKARCAVCGLIFRDHQVFAEDISEIKFFDNYCDFLKWLDTLESIFEVHERPIDVLMLHGLTQSD